MTRAETRTLGSTEVIPAGTGAADLAIVNAAVVTLDPARPAADAIAVRGGRVAALGRADVEELLGPSTRVIDAGGGAVLPGINDSHLHLVASAMTRFGYLRVDPAAAPTWDAVRARIAAAEPGADGWIRAHGWDDVVLGPARGRLLDVRPGVPVVAFDATGHQLAANRDALRAAGIGERTADPVGGVVERDAAGAPTGVLQDGAMALLSRELPPIPRDTLRGALLAMQRELHALGITSVTDPGLGPASAGLLDGSGSTEALHLLGDLALEGTLTLRTTVLALFAGTGGADAAAVRAGLASGLPAAYADRGIDPALLRIAGVKVFADGIPRSGTAWMAEPYGDACSHGSLVIAGRDDRERVEELGEILRLIDTAGLQAGIHATGDAATAAAVEALAAGTDPRRNRHYIIHGAFRGKGTLETMGRLGIGYSTNPLIREHAGDAMRRLLGQERFAAHQPLRTATAGGVHLTLASDAPVASIDWRRTVVAAWRRATASAPGDPADPERLGGLDSLRAMTATAAWQDHAERFKGTLVPGMAADLCVLSAPWPRDDEIESLLDADILLTVAGGRAVHEHVPA